MDRFLGQLEGFPKQTLVFGRTPRRRRDVVKLRERRYARITQKAGGGSLGLQLRLGG
jgi:hypothetical protein